MDKQTPLPKTMDEAMLAYQRLAVVATQDKKNPHFKNSYASLEAAIDAAREANQFGIYFEQPLDMIVLEGTIVQIVRTQIRHQPSGEMRQSICPIRTKDPSDPQKMGSGITYAKRYSLLAAFGLPTDDDANDAAKGPTKPDTNIVKVTPSSSNIEKVKF
jgi:hypothetical protein